jgi:hypothetical protein
MPYFFNMVSLTGTIFIAAAGVMFLWMAISHYVKVDDKSARIVNVWFFYLFTCGSTCLSFW